LILEVFLGMVAGLRLKVFVGLVLLKKLNLLERQGEKNFHKMNIFDSKGCKIKHKCKPLNVLIKIGLGQFPQLLPAFSPELQKQVRHLLV
jgi:hypothetical protein